MAKLYAAFEEPCSPFSRSDRFAALFQRARDDQNAGCQTDYVHAAIIADQMMSNILGTAGYMAICIMKTSCSPVAAGW
ncbi:aminoglycoside phosphotransferase family protein [Klebsiella pneumoniae]|uniref:aminoglycoside phosphotransferase family protein n=1 Tax=Klebsiella pneumoniae TaxID=573 RepID=UPI003D99B59F